MPETRTDSPETLLKELKGMVGLTSFKNVDAAKMRQPDPREEADRYRVAPGPDLRSTAQRADAAFSTKAGGRGYAAVVVGEYTALAATGNGKLRKNYRLTVNVASQEGALAFIVSKMLLRALKLAYPDAVNFRTHTVESFTPLTPDTPLSDDLRYMSGKQLVEFAQTSGAPLKVADYETVEELRESLVDWKLNPEQFKTREAERRRQREEEREIMRLNPQLDPRSSKETRIAPSPAAALGADPEAVDPELVEPVAAAAPAARDNFFA